MTITMSAKNQITIPRKLVNEMNLSEGALFDIRIKGSRIELVPMEAVERVFTDEEYAQLDRLCKKERLSAKPVTRACINGLKTGKD